VSGSPEFQAATVAGKSISTAAATHGSLVSNAETPEASKYPPAEPGALGIGPLEAATLNPKLCLLGRRTKYALPM
jgi:hypothetical protein